MFVQTKAPVALGADGGHERAKSCTCRLKPSLRKRPTTPDARELRYRILRPFKAVFGHLVPLEEINRLIESIPGVGLRLNLVGGVQILDEQRPDRASEIRANAMHRGTS